MSSQRDLVRIGTVPFALRDPHTLESIREDAARWVEGTLAVIASSDIDALTRCKRCGVIRIRGR